MKKLILFCCGLLLLVIAFIGVFLPVLPTTPLVILAAVCFSVSSPKAYKYLHKSRIFGPYIENYMTKKGLSPAAKARAIIALWCLLTISAISMRELWSTIMFLIIGLGVTLHLLLLKTMKKPTLPPLPAEAEVINKETLKGEILE